MKKIILFLGCCLLGWGTTDLLAQHGNVAAGGQATGAGGTASYSIGQVNYLTASGNNGSLIQGLQQPGGRTLCGTLTYDNVSATALNNCTVQLKQGNQVIAQTTTDATGFYQFNNPEPGTYTLDATSTKAWGSVNTTDALLILQHFLQINVLTGVRVAGADVNGSHYVNTADALITQKRFVGLQSSFVVGDWVFEHPTVVVTGSGNIVKDFKGLCYGDVDGSYIPPYVKREPTLFLENAGVQTIDNQQVVEVPVKLTQPMNSAAVSLILNFPQNELEILGVEAAYDNQTLVYNVAGGELRISWYSLDPKMLNKDDALFILKLKLKNTSDPSVVDLNFDLNPESSIANFNAQVMVNKTISVPFLVKNSQGFSLLQNVPNPFTHVTQISYVIPENANVKLELLDVVGKQISVLVDGQQAAGSHNYTLSGNTLRDGVYFYRMLVNTGSQQYSQTKRMIISR
jgi:hypothetical protein